jgi:hypothetical protein
VTIKGTSATLGNSNVPCMNPDFPTAILDRTSGGLWAVVTQQAGADLVAVDNGGCFDKTSCGQTGGVTHNDELEGSFGFHYFLASAAYHANGTAAAMCNITGTDAAGNPVTIPSSAGVNCFTTSGTTFVCPAQNAAFSGFIANAGLGSTGTILTVLNVASGTILPGGTLQGTGVVANTVVVSQLSGTPGGVGTYRVSFAQQVGAAFFRGSIATTTLTALAPTLGTIVINQWIQGANNDVAAGTEITALGSGTGGAGTYVVNNSQTVAQEKMAETEAMTEVGGFVEPCSATVAILTGAVDATVAANPTLTTTSYNCGSASALPGEAPGVAAAQIPGPGLLNSINADPITVGGQEWDPTPSPGPNTSPINNPAVTNAAAGGGQVPGWHTQGCSPNTSLIGSHSPSHSVAVDLITNQVFLAVPGGEVGTAQTNGMVTGQFAGWQTSSSVGSLIPIDPQYPPSAKGNTGGVCTPAKPCPGQQATPTVWDGFTRLCGTGIDNFGNTGSDTNGCILVLQDGP